MTCQNLEMFSSFIKNKSIPADLFEAVEEVFWEEEPKLGVDFELRFFLLSSFDLVAFLPTLPVGGYSQ